MWCDWQTDGVTRMNDPAISHVEFSVGRSAIIVTIAKYEPNRDTPRLRCCLACTRSLFDSQASERVSQLIIGPLSTRKKQESILCRSCCWWLCSSLCCQETQWHRFDVVMEEPGESAWFEEYLQSRWFYWWFIGVRLSCCSTTTITTTSAIVRPRRPGFIPTIQQPPWARTWLEPI